MKLLIDRIRKEGEAVNESVLKVGTFINHQVDSGFMDAIGKDLAEHFADYGITKVITIESSGIAPALMAADYLNVPLVILKKETSDILNGKVLQTKVTSYTKGNSYKLTLIEGIVKAGDRILLIDDFLAHGEAAMGATRLIEMAGAELVGIGILIEKSFQEGRKRLEDAGFTVYSQARIARLGKGVIEFVHEDSEIRDDETKMIEPE